MTRAEAIDHFHKITYRDSYEGTSPYHKADRVRAEEAIDGLVALGHLKLEPENTQSRSRRGAG